MTKPTKPTAVAGPTLADAANPQVFSTKTFDWVEYTPLAVQYIADSNDFVETKSDASATSATASADSATASAASATASANSATASATSATASEGFKDSAEVAAAAAQAAAGLPSLVGNAGKVLGVNTAENGVEWDFALASGATNGSAQTVGFSGDVVHKSTADAATVTYTFASGSDVSKVALVIEPLVIENHYIQNLESFPDDTQYAFSGHSLTDFRFSPDGTKLIAYDDSGPRLYEYSLSTAFDLNTISYSGRSAFVSDIQGNSIEGFEISSDGLKAYVLDAFTSSDIDYVREYDLASAFNLSSLTYVQRYNVSREQPRYIRLSPDGTKMYVADYSEDIEQYTLNTPYSLSSVSLNGRVDFTSEVGLNMSGFTFSDAGAKLYVTGTNGVFRYSLSTPYDALTATYDGVSGTGVGVGVTFRPDGEKVFDTGSGSTIVQQTSVLLSTLVFPSNVEIPTSGVPVVYEEKTALSIVTSDGGTSYQVTNVQGAIK